MWYITIKESNLRGMKWLKARKIPIPDDALEYAREIEIIEWLLMNNAKVGRGIINYAIRDGNLLNMRVLLAAGCYFDRDSFEVGVRAGNTENLEWMVSNGVLVTNRPRYPLVVSDEMREWLISQDLFEWCL